MTNEEAIKQIESAIISGSINNVQCGALKMAISSLESQRWIPVEERLPEENGEYLVAVAGDRAVSPYVTTWFFWNGKFEDFQYYSSRYVSYWLPIPQPPKEESKNDNLKYQDTKCNLKCVECSDRKYCDYFDPKEEST